MNSAKKDELVKLAHERAKAKYPVGTKGYQDEATQELIKLINDEVDREKEIESRASAKAAGVLAEVYRTQSTVTTSGSNSREGEIQALYARNPELAKTAGLVRYDVSKPVRNGVVLSFGDVVPVAAPPPGPGSRA
jgi:hypothetical protein